LQCGCLLFCFGYGILGLDIRFCGEIIELILVSIDVAGLSGR
jgi:hypothetical protein